MIKLFLIYINFKILLYPKCNFFCPFLHVRSTTFLMVKNIFMYFILNLYITHTMHTKISWTDLINKKLRTERKILTYIYSMQSPLESTSFFQ